ncbi:MAG: NADH-quinone oxidoreductase subunit C [Methanospirillum sp.]|nr:NADH-quinone oxidoreductase subunit C [Methanospirillum sp.]
MMTLNSEKDNISGLPDSWLIQKDRTACYYHVPADQFTGIVTTLKALESRLVSIIGEEGFYVPDLCSISYVFELLDTPRYLVLVLTCPEPESITGLFPAASFFERKISDGFGVRFSGSGDERRLFLHEPYPEGFHPMKKGYVNTPVVAAGTPCPFPFREMKGESVYHIPVGPVHAGIIEPGHFRFSVIGETIMNLEVRLGYLHRGIEKLMEGKDPDEGVTLAESISGDESAVNACGYALAVEQICMITVPERAEYIRGIILELERSYSLVSDLAGMVTDIGFPVAASRLLVLREELQRACDSLTGSRFLKGIIRIGGVSRDFSSDSLLILDSLAEETGKRLEEIVSWISSVPSVIDRFSTTGVIRETLIDPLALSGPVARASGRVLDVRVDHPYGIYRDQIISPVSERAGDVLARFNLKSEEILVSLNFIRQLVSGIPTGPVRCAIAMHDGFALAGIESPRGRTIHYVRIRDSRIERYFVATASFSNWQAIEHAVMGNIVPDFPLINKSLNLSYSGTDV